MSPWGGVALSGGAAEVEAWATEESRLFLVETLRGVYPEHVEGLRVT
jgi:hypothetical protein